MNATPTTASNGVGPLLPEPTNDRRKEPLRQEGKRYIVRDHISGVVYVAVALAAAQSLGWYNAWVLGVLTLGVKLTAAVLLTRYNPAVLNARGTKREMNQREKLFFSALIPSTLATPIVAGVDVGVAGWSHHASAELAIGIIMLVAGSSIITWALGVNAFFEPTVRLQRDRDHRVCAAGPYRYVRHPGYVGAILAAAAVPLILGSYWAFVPAALVTIAFVLRTSYEDRMLHEELAGYEAYADATRFRLVPFIW